MTEQSGPEEVGGYRRFTLDEVEVLHFPRLDEVCQAALIFAVGTRDETVPTAGVLHALEHVVMHACRRTPIEVNASVDPVQTTFIATGTPDRVADHLDQVCRTLTKPPVDRLAAEAKVLTVERRSEGESGWPMHRVRYGFTDLGVGDAVPPVFEHLSPEMVAHCAHTWFVASNAVLVISGPLPGSLRLPLRSAATPPRSWPAARPIEGPAAVLVDGPCCALNLVLPPVDASRIDLVAAELIQDRLTETLRHEAGHTYVVEQQQVPVGQGHWDLVVWAEPGEDAAVEAVVAMVGAVRLLSEVGPEQSEVDEAVARVIERTRGREAREAAIAEAAVEKLLGLRVPAPEPSLLQGLTASEVRSYLADVVVGALYLAPDEAEGRLGDLGVRIAPDSPVGVGPRPDGTLFRPPLLARALNREARQASVVLTDRGLVLEVGERWSEVVWAEVVGVARLEFDDMIVFGRSGVAIPLGPGFYRRGDRLTAAVVDHVPAELIYPADTGDFP